MVPIQIPGLFLFELYGIWLFVLNYHFIKFVILDENKYQKRMSLKVKVHLQSELKKNPSNDEVFKRVLQVSRFRDLVLALILFSILVLGIMFKKF